MQGKHSGLASNDTPADATFELMGTPIYLPLSGPSCDRAGRLCRTLIETAGLDGGLGWEATLEPLLTEMANDRVVGALTAIRLAQVAAAAAGELAEAELPPGSGEAEVAERMMRVVSELLEMVTPKS
jgi:hypothetical protein